MPTHLARTPQNIRLWASRLPERTFFRTEAGCEAARQLLIEPLGRPPGTVSCGIGEVPEAPLQRCGPPFQSGLRASIRPPGSTLLGCFLTVKALLVFPQALAVRVTSEG